MAESVRGCRQAFTSYGQHCWQILLREGGLDLERVKCAVHLLSYAHIADGLSDRKLQTARKHRQETSTEAPLRSKIDFEMRVVSFYLACTVNRRAVDLIHLCRTGSHRSVLDSQLQVVPLII